MYLNDFKCLKCVSSKSYMEIWNGLFQIVGKAWLKNLLLYLEFLEISVYTKSEQLRILKQLI